MTASSAAFASVFIRPLSSSSSAAAEAAAEVSPSSAPPPSSSSTAATAKGVNYLKSGSDPVIPSNLPEWISEVSSAPPAAFELRRALEQSSSAKQGGEDGNSLTGFLGAEGTSRLLKLEARARRSGERAERAAERALDAEEKLAVVLATGSLPEPPPPSQPHTIPQLSYYYN